MKPTITKPKIFISYAWGNDEHQAKVRSLASTLMSYGIDVILDQWNLLEGNDTYKFMEQTVTDPSITNVLILIDENYTNKANNRKGGVGTETQIITPEIYNKTDQTKFIPIIFEKKGGNVFVPTFLSSLKYVDLSQPEIYDDNLKYLTKILFGIKIHQKPELGIMPEWVINENELPVKHYLEIDSLNNNNITQKEKLKKASDLLNICIKDISEKEFDIKSNQNGYDVNDYFDSYKSLMPVKQKIFNIFASIDNIDGIGDKTIEFFEDLYNEIELKSYKFNDIKEVFLNGLFLTVIGHFYKIKDYDTIGAIISNTYMLKRYRNIDACSFSAFYTRDFQNLDNAINTVNKTNKLTASGDFWLTNLDSNFCDKESLISVDLLLNIYSQLQIITNLEVFWFPKLYVYDNYHECFKSFALKLKSKKSCLKFIKIFNLSSIEEFKKHFENIIKFEEQKRYQHYGYNLSYDSIPLLSRFIKIEEIGMFN